MTKNEAQAFIYETFCGRQIKFLINSDYRATLKESHLRTICKVLYDVQVKAENIVEKSSCGAVFCIIDCPSEYHLKQLQTNQELLSHQENGGRSLPTIIIHLSPAEIVETQDYQAWATR